MFVFFVPTGLGDHNLEVRKHMLNAALKAVNDHGKVCIVHVVIVYPAIWVKYEKNMCIYCQLVFIVFI